MVYFRTIAFTSMLVVGISTPGLSGASAQQDASQSCTGQLTEQLRRYSEKCLSELLEYVASQPQTGARISSESEKYYILLVKDAKGFRAEAVSKSNFPMIKDETADTLKRLGWAPPENENDNWKRPIEADRAQAGATARVLAEALEAYGLKKGEAISLTVGRDLSK
ncbi:TY-Chap domain-containing protein [Microvirga massiliensis]|uniref:TY-Chap domain-containing protein n=1 Tax=Microvirga massiliensis TaxID=1033741 RepID=UPI00062BC989|nr:hypothetical protein [Microvirga massiliensis]